MDVNRMKNQPPRTRCYTPVVDSFHPRIKALIVRSSMDEHAYWWTYSINDPPMECTLIHGWTCQNKNAKTRPFMDEYTNNIVHSGTKRKTFFFGTSLTLYCWMSMEERWEIFEILGQYDFNHGWSLCWEIRTLKYAQKRPFVHGWRAPHRWIIHGVRPPMNMHIRGWTC